MTFSVKNKTYQNLKSKQMIERPEREKIYMKMKALRGCKSMGTNTEILIAV